MNIIENMSPQELGERLRISRESAKITQEKAADAIGIARTTLVAIEKGERRIRIDELQSLANKYGISVNALLRNEAIHVDLVPRFRKLSETSDPDIDNAVRLLNDLISAEVELENILGIKRAKNYPPERAILPGDVKIQAEQDSNELRKWLGLGPLSPITDIVSLMELELGIRVYQRKLPTKISGLFAYEEGIGACIMLNADHPRERRSQTGSHELGHFIGTRRELEVYDDSETYQSRDEKYADVFGRSFLAPARAVMQKFKEITAGSSHLTRRHIILLAHFFAISREAMIRRLEELKLTKAGTWEWFESNGRITDEDARQVLGNNTEFDSAKTDAELLIPSRIGGMAFEAWKRDLLSEGQLARLLKIDRVQLRSYFDEVAGGESEENDLLKLPQ